MLRYFYISSFYSENNDVKATYFSVANIIIIININIISIIIIFYYGSLKLLNARS